MLVELKGRFNVGLDLKDVFYLIGLQVLNKGIKKFNKEDKLSIFHIATCKVLSSYWFYKFEGVDEAGWPHWKELKPIKDMNDKDQQKLMKEAIIEYFN